MFLWTTRFDPDLAGMMATAVRSVLAGKISLLYLPRFLVTQCSLRSLKRIAMSSRVNEPSAMIVCVHFKVCSAKGFVDSGVISEVNA